jgi:ABC-type lipoprotein release transport system permease subunit
VKTFLIAWRNLHRNRRRTAITFAAVSFSTAMLVASYALMIGWTAVMEKSVTDLSVGEVQVHHPDYRSERSLYDTVDGADAILQAAHRHGIAASARSFGYGLLSSGVRSAGGQFWGVNPVAERAVSDLAVNLASGTFLTSQPQRAVVLGRKLARTLGAEVGSELVVVVQAADGSMGNDLYTVAGILKGVGEGLDRSLALIHRSDFEELFVFPAGVHEIVANSRGTFPPEHTATLLLPASSGNEVVTWRELMPTLSQMFDSMIASVLIFGAIFLLAAGVGVLNTMMMATYERIPEFGLVKAMGASPWRILREIAAEAVILGLVGSLAGGAAGILITLRFQKHPLDLSMFVDQLDFMGIAVSSEIPFTLTAGCVFGPVLSMWAISVLAALWPAARAARMKPVEALTHV